MPSVTTDSISFGDDDEIIGPIPVPCAIAKLAEGWQILLSAARVDGEWRLLNVVNGEI